MIPHSLHTLALMMKYHRNLARLSYAWANYIILQRRDVAEELKPKLNLHNLFSSQCEFEFNLTAGRKFYDYWKARWRRRWVFFPFWFLFFLLINSAFKSLVDDGKRKHKYFLSSIFSLLFPFHCCCWFNPKISQKWMSFFPIPLALHLFSLLSRLCAPFFLNEIESKMKWNQ